MKNLFIAIVAIFLLSSVQKDVASRDYSDFIKYVKRGFKPTESIKKDCEWQYALVEVETDINNKITSCVLLNKASAELNNSFTYLLGYKFPKGLHIYKRPVVFCLSIENEKKACMPSNVKYSPLEVLGMVFADLQPAFKKNPRLIFLPDIITVAYSFDAVR